MRTILTALFILVGTSFVYGQQTTQEKEVVDTLDEFHQVIVENDASKAGELLSNSVRILEGGNVETKEEYLSHHFHSDGKFLSAMNREVDSQTVTVEGNTAWVSTRSHTWGTYSDRKLDLSSLELAVLQMVKGNWKISALHWSSSPRS